MDYSKSKIYKITSPNTDKIYIGSTTQKLYQRFNEHKKDNVNYSSKEIIMLGGSKIELIEDYPCNNKNELLEREQHYIDLNNAICINERRTIQHEDYKRLYRERNREIIREKAREFYQDNKEDISKKKKEHYHNNKEIIKERKSTRTLCECGSNVRASDKSRHIKTKKHLDFISIQ